MHAARPRAFPSHISVSPLLSLLLLLLLALLLMANDGALLFVRFPFENVRCLLEMPHHRRERGAALLPSGFAERGPSQDASDSERGLDGRATAMVLRLRLFAGDTAHISH